MSDDVRHFDERDDQDGPPGRFAYWASWRGNPMEGVRVRYRIPGQDAGLYQRPPGPPYQLLRWDRELDVGAVLTRHTGGRWQADDRPSRNVFLGSDYGEPVTVATARAIAAELGAPGALDDPDVVERPPPGA